ncbi:uncharacterized protein [Triticum aestivum]|uniref:uncharacterized protein isoform X2 n=1 Tax=Triticum aestivum TaxID=4565 RepID=UPI001D022322|nr:uncharacterized protein LOC123094692 isoform X2 [Triticum aestivum]
MLLKGMAARHPSGATTAAMASCCSHSPLARANRAVTCVQQTVPMPNQTFGGVGGALAAGRNHNKPGEEEVLRLQGATTTSRARRRWRAGAAEAAGARAARPDHQPTQHLGGILPGEDSREDKGPARTGAQGEQRYQLENEAQIMLVAKLA